MTERISVNPDMSFVRSLLGAGASELKYCYQCSTCTVVCPITPDGSPFPRKEMVQAQFGLKEQLVGSLDAWLCIHCNDCSTYCPRGAKPGDLMNTIRAMSIEHFAKPSFMAKWAATPSKIWLLFLIPILIIGAVIFGLHASTGWSFMQGEIVYSKMVPVPVVDMIFIPAMGFAGLTLLLGLMGFLKSMRAQYPRGPEGVSIVSAVMGAMVDIFSHRRFKDCGTNQARTGAHLMAMYGFLGLMLTTTLVGVMYYMKQFGMDVQVTPYDFFHPIKLIGNISGTMAFLACVLIVTRRMSRPEAGKATTFDWTFIWVLFFTIVTGFLAQVFRVFELAATAYITYYVHLVLVFFLLAFAAYTKMGHVFYRTVAMVYARWSGRSFIQPILGGVPASGAAAEVKEAS